MQNQRGFVGVGVLIAILIGLAVLGGGAYYVVQQNSTPQTASENILDNTTPTNEQNLVPTNTVSTKVSIAIDASALTQSADNPIITGTAKGVSSVIVEIRNPKAAGTVGSVMMAESTPVVNGKWSIAAPAVASAGTYKIHAYSHDIQDTATYNSYYDSYQTLTVTAATKAALNVPSDSMEKYYQDGALKKLPTADIATFEALVENYSSGGSILFRDKNNVYFYFTPSHRAEVVSGVDSKTFVHVKDVYYEDKNSVYYLDRNKDTNALVKIEGANPASFQALTYWYTKDNQRVFFLGVNNTGAIKINDIEGVSANSFSATQIGRFGSDSARVFSWGRVVVGVDVKTFSVLDDTYFKDASGVYMHLYSTVASDGTRDTKKLENVSPQNFVALGEGYGKTSDSVYFFDKKIVGADVATFKSTIGYGGGYGEDKNRTYKDGVVQ